MLWYHAWMLKHTFCHLPGVGAAIERRLWDRGVLSWDDFLARGGEPGCGICRTLKVHIEESVSALDSGDFQYFAERLPSKEHWRLFPHLKDRAAYIDIETNGYSGPAGFITAVSLYDGTSVKAYVRGKNLDAFVDDLADYRLIVSYNGRSFDVPFIEREFGVRLNHAHVDLRYLLRDLGFKGGLKGCEKGFGIERGELSGLDGYFAVLLWQDYARKKDQKSLETLLAYNVADVLSLPPLMVGAYNMKVGATPLRGLLELDAPESGVNPFRPDPRTIRRVASEREYTIVGAAL